MDATVLTAPAWAVPSPVALFDVQWLALAEVRRTRSVSAEGVHAAVCWVRGVRREAPVSERTECPVTAGLVESELIASMIASDPRGYMLSGPRLIQRYAPGVEYRPAVATYPVPYALAAWDALRWVTGEGGKRAPYVLPQRNEDGSARSADDLYRDALAAHPGYATMPEHRKRMRFESETEARVTRQLADAIAGAQAGDGTRPLRAR